MAHIDPSRLEESLEELRRQGLDHDLEQVLHTLTSGAQRLFDARGAGLMLMDSEYALRYVAATDEASRILEEAQEKAGDGPCVRSAITGSVVQTDDLTEDPRWPGLLAEHEGHGIRAVLGVPVRVAGNPIGSLDVYRDAPLDWDESDRDALVAFADLGEGALLSALQAAERNRMVAQLEGALESRVIIERAVGVLMERTGADATGAFKLLRTEARSRRTAVADLAGAVLEGETI